MPPLMSNVLTVFMSFLNDIFCVAGRILLTTVGAPVTQSMKTAKKAEQITTTILLRCKCLLGNFGTSVLVGVTLTCKTQLDIIADQVCPLKGPRQRDFMSLAPWIIWIPRAQWRASQLFFIFHCLFHSTPLTCAIFFSCSCVLYFWVHKP